MEQAAQGSGWVTIPGYTKKMCRYVTLGCGLAGMVMLGCRLDLMILEVFSNLWFYEVLHEFCCCSNEKHKVHFANMYYSLLKISVWASHAEKSLKDSVVQYKLVMNWVHICIDFNLIFCKQLKKEGCC